MSTDNAKVTVTNEQILAFRRNQESYSMNHAQQFRPFLYALSKMHKRLAKFEDDYNDELRLLNLEHASKDDKGYAITEKFNTEKRGEKKEDERFKFTISDQKKLNVAQRELLNKTVQVEQYLCAHDIPDDLDFSWWGVFAPFVLPEEPSEAQLEELYKRTEAKVKPKMQLQN